MYIVRRKIYQKDFSKFKGSRKLGELLITEGKFSPHIFGNRPTDTAIRAFRDVNSPLSMRKVGYAKKMGLDKAETLNLKISTKSNRELRRQAGGKISGKGSKSGHEAITPDGRAGYGGGYVN